MKACRTWPVLPLAGLMASDPSSPTSILLHQRLVPATPLPGLLWGGLRPGWTPTLVYPPLMASEPEKSIFQSSVGVPPCTSWQFQDFPAWHAGRRRAFICHSLLSGRQPRHGHWPYPCRSLPTLYSRLPSRLSPSQPASTTETTCFVF